MRNPSAREDFFMKKISILGIIFLIVAGVFVYHPSSKQQTISAKPTVVSSPVKAATYSYKGESGFDALTLLKKHASVEQDKSGLVVSINGNKPTGHNYWAFYVNGTYAQVGPAQYQTKNGDKIEWKIEKY